MADRTEQRLRDALNACADQVTEESLSLPPDLPRPKQRRWTALASAAAVFVLVAGIAVVVFTVDRDYEPVAPPPAPTSEPVPTSTPGSAACQPGEPCVIQTVNIRGEKLEVLAKNAPGMPGLHENWVLRAGEDVIARGGVADGADIGEARGLRGRINAYVRADSLECFDFSFDDVPALCLLDTYGLGDANDVLGLSRTSSGWYVEARYPTPFDKESLDLQPGDDIDFHVVAVQHDPDLVDQPSWWARVWHWDGTEAGCTKPVRSKEELPGWPEVNPSTGNLDPANCVRR